MYLAQLDVALSGGRLSRAPSLASKSCIGRAQGQSRASRSPPARLPIAAPHGQRLRWRPPRGGSPWRLPVAARRRSVSLASLLASLHASLLAAFSALFFPRFILLGGGGVTCERPLGLALATATAAVGSATEGLVPAAAATGRVARRVARRQRRPYTPKGVAPGRARTRACRPHRPLPLPASQSHCAVGAEAGAGRRA